MRRACRWLLWGLLASVPVAFCTLAVYAVVITVWPGCRLDALVRGPDPDRLNGGGSTFVYPMMAKWSSEYDKAKGVEVNYQSIGSGGGIQQMTAKTFDFGCTDGPMNEEQLEEGQGHRRRGRPRPSGHGAPSSPPTTWRR